MSPFSSGSVPIVLEEISGAGSATVSLPTGTVALAIATPSSATNLEVVGAQTGISYFDAVPSTGNVTNVVLNAGDYEVTVAVAGASSGAITTISTSTNTIATQGGGSPLVDGQVRNMYPGIVAGSSYAGGISWEAGDTVLACVSTQDAYVTDITCPSLDFDPGNPLMDYSNGVNVILFAAHPTSAGTDTVTIDYSSSAAASVINLIVLAGDLSLINTASGSGVDVPSVSASLYTSSSVKVAIGIVAGDMIILARVPQTNGYGYGFGFTSSIASTSSGACGGASGVYRWDSGGPDATVTYASYFDGTAPSNVVLGVALLG